MHGTEFHFGRPVSGAALVGRRLREGERSESPPLCLPRALAGRPRPRTRRRTHARAHSRCPRGPRGPRRLFGARGTDEQLLGWVLLCCAFGFRWGFFCFLFLFFLMFPQDSIWKNLAHLPPRPCGSCSLLCHRCNNGAHLRGVRGGACGGERAHDSAEPAGVPSGRAGAGRTPLARIHWRGKIFCSL